MKKETVSPELALYWSKVSGKRWILAGLGTALILLMIAASGAGASSVGLSDVLTVFGDVLSGTRNATAVQHSIVLQTRLPRIVCAVLAGGALSLAGLLMQGVFRNPLVSPYTLGISNGASFGASLAIVLGYQIPGFVGVDWLTPALAFVSALVAMMAVYAIARAAGQSTRTLVLTGVAVGYLFSALVSALKYLADVSQLPELVFWTMGSMTGLDWAVAAILATVMAVSVVVSLIFAWDLNVMALGREEAAALGVRYNRLQILAFFMAAILTASTVSFTGVIGFVGLVAPHMTRMFLGSDYRYNVPGAALLGGFLLLLADTLARTVAAPTELPVGIITSLIGVPFYLYLIVRRRRVA